MDKFDDVFKILKENSFEIDETIKDYLCIICKRILSNAHSGPCGCRFCYDCIGKFLNNKEKFCPGDANECKQEKLNLSQNIHYEPSVNKRISKLIVKCPKGCQFKDEMRNIENHIRLCNFRQINCPYFNIGCKQSNLINDDMKNHFLSDIVPHSNLLLELIENMRNEMELLKKDIGELKDENKSLNDENQSLKDEIEAIKLNIIGNQITISELTRKEKMNNDKIIEINKEMTVLKNKNQYLQDKIEKMNFDKTIENINNTIVTVMGNAEQQTVEIDEIKIKLLLIENHQKEFMNRFDENSTGGNEQLMRKSNEIDEMMNCSITQINEFSKVQEEFEWKIEFSKLEKDKQIHSNQFSAFPNGYKMCLSINVGQFLNTVFLHAYLHLMRSEFDDNLAWPCKCDVSIDLINQNNYEIYKSDTIYYNNRKDNSSWKKPTNERNEGIHFLSVSLSNIRKLLKNNDQFSIKCKTSIPQ